MRVCVCFVSLMQFWWFSSVIQVFICSSCQRRVAREIERVDWSSHSPDVNPIENVWFGVPLARKRS